MGPGEQPTTLIPDGGDIFYTEYHDESPVEAVSRGISALEGTSVEDIPPLYDYIDADSMNQMMETARDENQDVTVHLTVEEYKVAIESDGTVSIRDLESSNDPPRFG